MRTEILLTRICELLQENCGDIADACRRCGISLMFVAQWRKDDQKVNERITMAEQIGTEQLVSEAIRRGQRGYEEEVWYQGRHVGDKKVYSDSLLTTLLKAKRPEFNKDSEGGPGGVTVNVAIVPRAANYQEWLDMKASTDKVLLEKEALKITQQLPEAEFEVLKPFGDLQL